MDNTSISFPQPIHGWITVEGVDYPAIAVGAHLQTFVPKIIALANDTGIRRIFLVDEFETEKPVEVPRAVGSPS